MNRRVALKVVSRQIGKDRALLERFFAEARAIAALDHPNIVQAYSVDNEGDRIYIVMEYVAGQDLQHLVEREGPLECSRAANYIGQAADGLAHAHARNMVHCDIKPSNLIVNNQGVVKILDMGLRDWLGAGATRSGRRSGSSDRSITCRRNKPWERPASTTARTFTPSGARSISSSPAIRRFRRARCLNASSNTRPSSRGAFTASGRTRRRT